MVRTVLLTVTLVTSLSLTAGASDLDLFVAMNGDDAWSGKLSAPNREKADGPLASLAGARDAIRAMKKVQGKLPEPVHVLVRGGVYAPSATVTFAPEDSGTQECPVSFEAYPGETPVLCGGRAVANWHKGARPLRVAEVPEAKGTRPPGFQQFFVDGRRQIRARHPNFDASHPTTGGFLIARPPADWQGGFGATVRGAGGPGDFLEYALDVPTDGQYTYWLYYGSYNKRASINKLPDM